MKEEDRIYYARKCVKVYAVYPVDVPEAEIAGLFMEAVESVGARYPEDHLLHHTGAAVNEVRISGNRYKNPRPRQLPRDRKSKGSLT